LLGAGVTAFFFVALPGRLWFVLAGAFVLVPVMVAVAFGFRGWRAFLRRLSLGLLSAVLLEGAVSAVCSLTGLRTLPVYAAVLAFMVARVLARSLVASARSLRRQFALTLCHRGRSVRCFGLYDSGNLLVMPHSGEPVHIIAPQVLRQLLGDGEIVCGERVLVDGERVCGGRVSGDGQSECGGWPMGDGQEQDGVLGETRTIGYRALGTDIGQIRVFRIDRMEIQQKTGTKILEHPWVGCAQESLLRGKPYQVILHAGVVDNE
jgi:hypothetical protein